MAHLKVISCNGEEAELNVQEIISIDDKPYVELPPDAGLEHRVSNLEQLVVKLLGDKSCQPKESYFVESQYPQHPEHPEHPRSSLDESPESPA